MENNRKQLKMKYKHRITQQRPVEEIKFQRLTGGIGFRYDKPKPQKARRLNNDN